MHRKGDRQTCGKSRPERRCVCAGVQTGGQDADR